MPEKIFGIQLEVDYEREVRLKEFGGIFYRTIVRISPQVPDPLFVSNPVIHRALSNHPELLNRQIGEIDAHVDMKRRRIVLDHLFPIGLVGDSLLGKKESELPLKRFLLGSGVGKLVLDSFLEEINRSFEGFRVTFRGRRLPHGQQFMDRLGLKTGRAYTVDFLRKRLQMRRAR